MSMEQRFGPVCVVFLLFLIQHGSSERSSQHAAPRLPLYLRKAQELLLRQKAYHGTQQNRMHVLSKSLATFARDLYSFKVSGSHGNSSSGNVIMSPLGAYASLAMMLTASRGWTKREVITALGLDDITGVHHSLQRAFESYRDDDSYDVNSDVSDGGAPGGGQADLPGLSETDLEDMMRNDYLVDNNISYSAGQTNLMFSDGTIVSEKHNHDDGDDDDGKDVSATDNISIRFANGMFHDEDVDLSQRYIMRLASLYGAPPMAMENSTPEDSVNLWADAATYGAISRVLETGNVRENTLLLLISAAYFRAAWRESFDEVLVPVDFKTGSGDVVMADCMFHVGNYSVKTLEYMSTRVLEIPYAGGESPQRKVFSTLSSKNRRGRYSLYVFLPYTKNIRRGLRALEEHLKKADLQALLHDMPEPSKSLVMIPKFSLTSSASLKPVLQAMGAHRVFMRGKADLGRMTDETKSRLYVNDVIQRVTLHVDEGKSRDVTDSWVSVDVTDEETLLGASHTSETTSKTLELNENDKSEDYDDDDDDEEGEGDYYEDDDDEAFDNNDYDDGAMDSADFHGHFIVDRPFFFMVKDNALDLILVMGRVTNPLP